jgi:hypothetical protein
MAIGKSWPFQVTPSRLKELQQPAAAADGQAPPPAAPPPDLGASGESVAGEEDPGAALDVVPPFTPPGPAHSPVDAGQKASPRTEDGSASQSPGPADAPEAPD